MRAVARDAWLAASAIAGNASSVHGAGQAARRAPVWMQRLGIEWFHRILTDPARLLKRYVGDVVPFLRVVRQSHASPGH